MRALTLLALCIFAASSLSATAQSLSGLQIGGRIGSTILTKQKPLRSTRSGPFNIQKWRLEDSNDLSATSYAADGHIVYVETDWNNQSSGAIADFGGFTYGKTTLADIEARFASRGILFKNHSVSDTGNGDIVRYNSFAVEGLAKVLVTFVTRISKQDIKRNPGSKAVDDHSLWRLDAIILSDSDYVSSIWGDQVNIADDYKPISWVENGPDAQFDAQFKCPDSFSTAADREAALTGVAEWAKAHHSDWDLDAIIASYRGLLREHNCSQTLGTTNDLRIPNVFVGHWSDAELKFSECNPDNGSVTTVTPDNLQAPELFCKPLSVPVARDSKTVSLDVICSGEGEISIGKEIWGTRMLDGVPILTIVQTGNGSVDVTKQCPQKPKSTTQDTPSQVKP